MKWTIAFLVMMGVVAAICVALLVNAVRIDSMVRGNRGEVPVILTIKDVPAMSVLTSDAIEIGKAKAKEAPAGYFTSPTQVVGRIVAMPLVKGQTLTKSCFISEGSGAQLMAALPAGMRAVSITLTSQSVSGGLMYPGCIVDVLASFKLSGGYSREDEGKGEAISTTLLHAVQVLAIEGESVISQPELADKAEKKRLSSTSSSQKLTVTLLVNPKQAEALQLALDNGSVSLTMRNPLDTALVSSEATVLSRGKLSRLGSLLDATVNATPASPDAQGPVQSPILPFEEKSSNWGVTVIRGNQIAEEEVKVDE